MHLITSQLYSCVSVCTFFAGSIYIPARCSVDESSDESDEDSEADEAAAAPSRGPKGRAPRRGKMSNKEKSKLIERAEGRADKDDLIMTGKPLKGKKGGGSSNASGSASTGKSAAQLMREALMGSSDDDDGEVEDVDEDEDEDSTADVEDAEDSDEEESDDGREEEEEVDKRQTGAAAGDVGPGTASAATAVVRNITIGMVGHPNVGKSSVIKYAQGCRVSTATRPLYAVALPRTSHHYLRL